jgi:topoisomerase IV subunit A
MVRLAQEFAQRYPLVDGQGNFGNVDGDNAAAMRYTEARLTDVAALLLEGIDEDAVDFRPTYDGEGEEPVVLPAPFRICSPTARRHRRRHGDLDPAAQCRRDLRCAVHLIKAPKATVGKLIDLMPGPDFPTGGVLVESARDDRGGLRTGRGSLRLRARWKVEKIKGGDLADRRHRDSLPGAEGAPDRADRRAAAGKEAADARGRARRIDRATCASCWSRRAATSIPTR